MKAPCEIAGCERKHHAKGLCFAHYLRLRRSGKVRPEMPLNATDATRFWAKVDRTGTCWEWLGATTKHGHGQFGVGNSVVYAHRFAYELLIGSLYEGRGHPSPLRQRAMRQAGAYGDDDAERTCRSA